LLPLAEERVGLWKVLPSWWGRSSHIHPHFLFPVKIDIDFFLQDSLWIRDVFGTTEQIKSERKRMVKLSGEAARRQEMWDLSIFIV
jgi:hypothetical protein